MTTNERSRYLHALGLVDWRQRQTTADRPADDVQPAAPVLQPATANAPSARPDDGPGSDSPTPGAAADVAEMDWAELQHWLARQDHRGARNPVFGIGATNADLLIIGEAPGAEEDRQGKPFVGPSGQLLDHMLATIGRSRQRNVYITNICKFRPPGNRDPHADEIQADRPVLERQIELLQPRLLVAVGRVAAQTLLGRSDRLGAMRNQVYRYPGHDLPVMVTYHPAYLLRSPQDKAKAWADLKRMVQLLRRNDAQATA